MNSETRWEESKTEFPDVQTTPRSKRNVFCLGFGKVLVWAALSLKYVANIPWTVYNKLRNSYNDLQKSSSSRHNDIDLSEDSFARFDKVDRIDLDRS